MGLFPLILTSYLIIRTNLPVKLKLVIIRFIEIRLIWNLLHSVFSPLLPKSPKQYLHCNELKSSASSVFDGSGGSWIPMGSRFFICYYSSFIMLWMIRSLTRIQIDIDRPLLHSKSRFWNVRKHAHPLQIDWAVYLLWNFLHVPIQDYLYLILLWITVSSTLGLAQCTTYKYV